ncbi:hypothetical protein [Ruminococcus flavefaciens]|uniref:hypothetical protein n=1 Tax=Ruminococcus flavefaciens TaxID=1265 RepID=UPI001A9A6B78|nr:hypothetical protein [Ruminococcus flavefaciens]
MPAKSQIWGTAYVAARVIPMMLPVSGSNCPFDDICPSEGRRFCAVGTTIGRPYTWS